ncbi:hypothetical protein [Saccharothrix xinjiangensis]|uniref:Polyketide cyclase/dehydrase/lipid transport protein n=1 Tax=Saccharothrix xinjiangensis TaxID=204798 RepID=A0ABV9XZK6_9PSEU
MNQPLDIDLVVDEAALDERVEGAVLLDRAGIANRVGGVRASLWRSRPRRHELTDGTAAVRWDLRCDLATDSGRTVESVVVTVDFAAETDVQVAAVSPVSGPGPGYRVRASGPRFRYARWVFDADAGHSLDPDHRVALLATVPTSAATVSSRITVRAEAVFTGLLGRIPLLGRRAVELHAADLAGTTD